MGLQKPTVGVVNVLSLSQLSVLRASLQICGGFDNSAINEGPQLPLSELEGAVWRAEPGLQTRKR